MTTGSLTVASYLGPRAESLWAAISSTAKLNAEGDSQRASSSLQAGIWNSISTWKSPRLSQRLRSLPWLSLFLHAANHCLLPWWQHMLMSALYVLLFSPYSGNSSRMRGILLVIIKSKKFPHLLLPFYLVHRSTLITSLKILLPTGLGPHSCCLSWRQ